MPGLKLAGRFYSELVADIVGTRPHAAALIGEGSEVLGFDTPRSTDHGWGPRLQVFVRPGDVDALRGELDERLPERFSGWPVQYYNWRTDLVEHHVEVATLGAWLTNWLGFDPRAGMQTTDWLTTPQQLLLEVTSGAVFGDDMGELRAVRDQLAWYPDDIWLFLMASEWGLLAATEAFLGRTAEVGDELGSQLAATNVARSVIRLCFLQERRYAPYAKWIGTAAKQLGCWRDIGPHVEGLLSATQYEHRENAYVAALTAAADRHNELAVTAPVDLHVRQYEIFGATRPYVVVNAREFSTACRDGIADRSLAQLVGLGSVDQLLARTDQLVHLTDVPRRLAGLYHEALESGHN